MQDLNLHMFSHGFRLASGHNAGFCQPSVKSFLGCLNVARIERGSYELFAETNLPLTAT
jgi:hypothetical protein